MLLWWYEKVTTLKSIQVGLRLESLPQWSLVIYIKLFSLHHLPLIAHWMLCETNLEKS